MHLIFTGEDFNKSCVNLPQMRPIYWIWEVWRAICVWDGVWLRRDSLLTKEWGQSTRINRTGFPKVGVLIFSWELSPAIHFIPGAISIFLHFDGNKSSCFLFCFFFGERDGFAMSHPAMSQDGFFRAEMTEPDLISPNTAASCLFLEGWWLQFPPSFS